jgi:hypothetical protein
MAFNRHSAVRLIAGMLAVGGCYWAFVLAGWTLMLLVSFEFIPFLLGLLLCLGYWVWCGWILRASNRTPLVRVKFFWLIAIVVNIGCAIIAKSIPTTVWCVGAALLSLGCMFLDRGWSNPALQTVSRGSFTSKL